MIERKQIKATITKAGGTASKNNQMVRVVIPAPWCRTLEITKESPMLEAEFDGEEIRIRKTDNC